MENGRAKSRLAHSFPTAIIPLALFPFLFASRRRAEKNKEGRWQSIAIIIWMSLWFRGLQARVSYFQSGHCFAVCGRPHSITCPDILKQALETPEGPQQCAIGLSVLQVTKPASFLVVHIPCRILVKQGSRRLTRRQIPRTNTGLVRGNKNARLPLAKHFSFSEHSINWQYVSVRHLYGFQNPTKAMLQQSKANFSSQNPASTGMNIDFFFVLYLSARKCRRRILTF